MLDPGVGAEPPGDRRAAQAAARQRSFLPDDSGARGEADPDRSSRKTRTLQAAVHLADDVHRLVMRTDTEVAWVDGTRRNVRLRLSPIDVGPALAEILWGEVTSVLTSATIPPRIVERVGLQRFPSEELNVGSPFDYRSHALLYVARHLPDRRPEGAEEALHEELALLLGAAGGRTLALFTSRRATEAAAAALRARAPLSAAAAGRPAEGSPSRGVRAGRDLVPLRHPRLLAGRRHPGPGPFARHHRPAPLPPARRPPAPGAPRPGGRRRRLPAGRPPPGRHPARPGCGAAHPHGGGPWRCRGSRSAPGHRVLPRRAALDAPADAALGGF